MSFWSSATEPKRDSCSRCQETSSTTAVWPVKMVLASTTLPSLGTALMSHRQIVCWQNRNPDCTHENLQTADSRVWQLTLFSVRRLLTQYFPWPWLPGMHQNICGGRSYMIIWGTEQAAGQVGVPGEPITLLLMASETQVWTALSWRICRAHPTHSCIVI